jgi:Large polyvalent protein associated domain 38
MDIREVRQKFPQYNTLSDVELADALHEKFYPSIPLPEFYEKIGLSKRGLGAAVSKGAESLLSQGRTGLASLMGSPEDAASAGLARGEDINKRYAQQVSLDKVKQAYEKNGVLSAAGEAVSQIPAAIAEQAPNIAATLGSARAGAALGSFAGPAGAVIGGFTGAAVPSLLQQFGGNIERQAQEGNKTIDRSAALTAAVPQAALDVAGSFIPLGGRLVSSLTGIPEKALLGKSAAQVERLANERLMTTLAKGTATGMAAEIPTEIAQQMLQRSQAGLSLSSPDALAEYGETAYQVGLLGPIGAVGRLSERGGARNEQERNKQLEQRKAQLEAMDQEAAQERKDAETAAAEELRKQTPEYATEFRTNYDSLLSEYQQLKSSTPKKAPANATPEQTLTINENRAKLKEMYKQLTQMTPEYQRVKSIAEQAEQNRLAGIEQQAAQEIPQEAQQNAYFESPQGTLPGIQPVAPVETVTQIPEPQKVALEFAQKQQELFKLLESHQQKESEAAGRGDTAAIKELRKDREMLRNEYDYVSKQLQLVGGYKPVGQEATQLEANLAKAREQLKGMSGDQYDPDKADKLIAKIDAIEARLAETGPAAQQGFDFGTADKQTSSETTRDYNARKYQERDFLQGNTVSDAQEAEALAESRRAEEAARADAEREQKIAPELLALRRLAANKDMGPEMGIEIPASGETQKFPSAAIGQMKQLQLGEDVTATAEEPRARGEAKRVPGEGFRLFNRRGEQVLPTDVKSLSERLARLMANKNLTQDAYSFLRRAEAVLPTAPAEFRDVLGEQLNRIEQGEEGVPRKGGYSTLEAFPIGDTRVQKRTKDVQDTTLRGPSTKPQPLSLQAELEPILRTQEQAAGEGPLPAKQRGLFDDETEKLGFAKTNRAAFIQFMRGKFVQGLKAKLQQDKAVAKRAEELPKLRTRVEQLAAGVAEMEKVNLQYAQAARILQHERDLGKVRRNMSDILGALTKVSVEGMQLDGRIEELQRLRGELMQEGRALGETVELPFLDELNNIEEQLTRAQTDSLELRGALNTLKGQLRVQDAKATLAKLNPQTTPASVLEKAKETLRAAQVEAGIVETEVAQKAAKESEAAATKRRSDEAVEEARTRTAAEKASNKRSKSDQERLEELYGEESQGKKFNALTLAQKEARDSDSPILTEEERTDEEKNPRKVLGGYKGRIKELERVVMQSQAKSDAAVIRSISDLKDKYESLDRQYKNAKTSAQRAELAPVLAAAEAKYNQALRSIKNAPRRPWIGMGEQLKELANMYRKHDDLEAKIGVGKIASFEEQVIRKPAKPTAKQVAETNRIAKELTTQSTKERATAPTTSGESLTKTEAKKAGKAQKTQFSSKNTGRDDKEGFAHAINIVHQKQAAGKVLSAFDEHLLVQEKRLKYQTSVETMEVPLSENAVAELKGGNLAAALNDVAKTSASPMNRMLAERLKMILGKTKAHVVEGLKTPEGWPVHGGAATDGMDVYFDSKTGLNEETLLHEAVHAATERIIQMDESKLTPEQLTAKRELVKLYNAIKDDPSITSDSAKESLSEFVAEAMTNSALQEQLKQKSWTLGNAWRSFKRILLNMMGVDTPTNMLDSAIAATDTLFSRPMAAVNPDTKLAYQKAKYNNATFAAAGAIGDKFIAQNRTFYDSVKANATGLAFETQLVDRFAGFERLSKTMDPLKGSQMMFYLRMYDQRMNFTSQSASNGALGLVEKTRADGRKEYVIESGGGPSLKSTVDILKEAAPIVGNGEAVNRLFTLDMSAIRAKEKGIATLNFGGRITQAELDKAQRSVDSDPKLREIFTRARREYNNYNRDMLNFVAQTGALSKETVAKLLKENDYIPWYRQRNGVAELIIGSEAPVRIGSIASQPYLQELVGGDAPILDFMTSSVQNTSMLTDMALRNLATKNAVFELVNLDLAKIGKGHEVAGPDVVKFRDNGVEKYALIDTDKAGIPADILVKGMEGIPTQMPFVFRVMAMPARLLRKAVTASPLYAGKQLFRDSLAAPLVSGADFMPVMGALREIGSATKGTLERRGVTGGQIFTGTNEDLTLILKRITDNKPGWMNSLAKWEAISMESDALTRRAQYNSYINQGLSEMEATLMSLESMNFNKRGASPSIHVVSSLIPFFNAQIQSLNVLYKALRGKLPFNEKLKIQEKLLTRGAMLAGVSLAYASMMQDDEAYKNATPDQKYANWFIRVPGVDEPVRLPIPFEIGYIFKALPEAIYNSMLSDHGAEDATKAFKQILLQLIPGGTSYGLPQALRPAIEAGLGKSFYTGRDILSPYESAMLPENQFRENTTEISKLIGKTAGVSPIKIDELVRGYTGAMGLAFLQAVSLGVPKGVTPEKAVQRMSDIPVVGGLFQPNDAGGIISNVYDRMNEIKQIQATVDDLIDKGKTAEARELINKYSTEYATSELADYYTTGMREYTQYELAIKASSATPEEKRAKLDELRQAKIRFATMVRDATDRTKRQ